MKLWLAPQVTLIGATQFFPPKRSVNWKRSENDGRFDERERLIEYAGRQCYQSWDNASGKTTPQYIANLLKKRHGSVLEHVVLNFDIQGVSRSLTHELITHRVGTAKSQLSQRYVNHFDIVVPPVIADDPEELEFFRGNMLAVGVRYRLQIERLKAKGFKGKKLLEAARAHLPNATETKLVWSANLRTLRYVAAVRTGTDADAEIQRLGRSLLAIAREVTPASFQDFQPTGGEPENSKV